MKELIARTQKEWRKLRRRLSRADKPLPRHLPPDHLAAILVPTKGEAARITGHVLVHDNPHDKGDLIIEWQKTAGKKDIPDIAFIRHGGARVRMLKVFNPSVDA